MDTPLKTEIEGARKSFRHLKQEALVEETLVLTPSTRGVLQTFPAYQGERLADTGSTWSTRPCFFSVVVGQDTCGWWTCELFEAALVSWQSRSLVHRM